MAVFAGTIYRQNDRRSRSLLDFSVPLSVLVVLLVAEYEGPLLAVLFACAAPLLAVLVSNREGGVLAWTPLYWLFAILVLGCVSRIVSGALGQTVFDVDLQRDLAMSVSNIVLFAVGSMGAAGARSYRLLLAAIVAAGTIVSLVHLLRLSVVLAGGVSDLYQLRLDAGRGSITQFAALCACILLYSTPWMRMRLARRRLLIILAICICCSIMLTLSRGLILLLIILLFAAMGLGFRHADGKMRARGVRIVATILALSVAFGITFFLLAHSSNPTLKTLGESFLSRLRNSGSEISSSDFETKDQITEDYRAFELDRAVAQFEEQSPALQWIGQGWGSAVNFGIETASTQSDFSRTSAAFLHNGYAYFLMKTGFLGLATYLGFIVTLLFRAVSTLGWSGSSEDFGRRRVLLVGALALAVGTITTGGLGFPAVYLGLLVLLGVCYPAMRFELLPEHRPVDRHVSGVEQTQRLKSV